MIQTVFSLLLPPIFILLFQLKLPGSERGNEFTVTNCLVTDRGKKMENNFNKEGLFSYTAALIHSTYIGEFVTIIGEKILRVDCLQGQLQVQLALSRRVQIIQSSILTHPLKLEDISHISPTWNKLTNRFLHNDFVKISANSFSDFINTYLCLHSLSCLGQNGNQLQCTQSSHRTHGWRHSEASNKQYATPWGSLQASNNMNNSVPM